MIGVLFATACSGGSHGSYGSTSGGAAGVPTTVAGKSDTSGISAGSAVQAPNATPSRAP
jgi:hypothetical protein